MLSSVGVHSLMLFVVRCAVLVVCSLLLILGRSWFVGRCLLSMVVVCCLLLFDVCCLFVVVVCLFFVV